MTPLAIVQGQLDAYNARDLDSFLAFFSERVQVFRPHTAGPSLSGKAEFARFYASERFNRPGLRAELLSRMVLGERVIDHERIWGVTEQPIEMAVVYELREGLIETLWAFPA